VKNIVSKFKESFISVLPIFILVLILCKTIIPFPETIMPLFIIGTVFLVIGSFLFTLGADIAMMPMGEKVGAALVRTRKIPLILGITFLMGFLVTIAEPDLQVLATQITSIPNVTMVACVAVGVALFLVVALFRTFFRLNLSKLLIIIYGIIFLIALVIPKEFLGVAFDAGGVTTGPMTVPFLLAFGIGIAAVRGSKTSRDDSFGMVALCSAGPILAVFILKIVFDISLESKIVPMAEVHGLSQIIIKYLDSFGYYLEHVAISLLPILLIFLLFNTTLLKLPSKTVVRIFIGILYTYIGLALFLTGVNVGFLPMGTYLGQEIARVSSDLLVPIGLIMGFLIIFAEPAVYVLTKQVEEITGGSIPKILMLIALGFGVALSIVFAMYRIIYGVELWCFLLGGYAIALFLSLFVSEAFTAIAFDSGGVASGTMAAAFILPLCRGACQTLGGDIIADAFGVIGLVAMMPIITIQILGLVYKLKTIKGADEEDDEEIIELDYEGGGSYGE